MNDIIENIKRHEGFVNHVYKDSLGKDTIGYGTLMPISKKEAELLLKHRLEDKTRELVKKEPFFNELPSSAQFIILEMCYQLGVNGVLNFKKMWKALKRYDFEEAAKEGRDSLWWKEQTRSRAEELMSKLESL